MDLEDNTDVIANFDRLQSLRHLEEKVVPLSASFRASLVTIRMLGKVNQRFLNAGVLGEDQFSDMADVLAFYENQLNGHLDSVKTFQERIQGIMALVSSPCRMTQIDTQPNRLHDAP